MRRALLLLPLLCAAAALGSAPARDELPAAIGPLSQEHALLLLGRELTTHFNLEGDLQLELLRPWVAPIEVAAHWDLTILQYPAAPASSMLVRCRLLGDGVALGETTLVVRASLWRDAWVSRQPLAANAPFDASLLEARRVDLLRERDALPASIGDRSYIFARGVSAGRQLTWRDVARRPLVRKGDIVEVTAEDGLLTVTLKALAMQNGAAGETVTVRNPESRKDFAALVIDENRVRVRF